MLSSLRGALAEPASFFQREAADPRLREPAIVVAVVGIVGLLSSVPVFGALLGAVPAAAGPFLLIGLAVGAAIALVSPFAVWLLYAVLFLGLSALFDGQGSLRDLFALVGWGFAPDVLSQLVGGLVLLVLVSRGEFADPSGAAQFAQSATRGPLGLFNRGFSLLMTLWSAWIWTHAVAAGRDLTRRQAAVVVGVVVIATVGLGLASTAVV